MPILAVVACFCQGETRLIDAGIARKKESDRLAAITQELRKMGAAITELEDSLIIQGGKKLIGASVASHHDHRIALSLAVAAMAAHGATTISDTRCIAKSYPDFAESFRQLGAKIEIHRDGSDGRDEERL